MNLEKYQPKELCSNAMNTALQLGLVGLAAIPALAGESTPPAIFNMIPFLSPLLSSAIQSRQNRIQAFWNKCTEDSNEEISKLQNRMESLEENQKEYVLSVFESLIYKVAFEVDDEKLKYFGNSFKSIVSNLPIDQSQFKEASNFIEILNELQLLDLSILAYLYPRFDELQEMELSQLPFCNDFGRLLNIPVDYADSEHSTLRLDKAGLVNVAYLPRSGAVTPQLKLSDLGKKFAEFCLHKTDLKHQRIIYPAYKYNLIINNHLQFEYYSFSTTVLEEHLPDYLKTEVSEIPDIQTVEIKNSEEIKFVFERGYNNSTGWTMSMKQPDGNYNHRITAHEALNKGFIKIVV